MGKKLKSPEHLTRADESNRSLVDGLISIVPSVGGFLSTLGRVAFPSKRDQRVQQWHDDVTDCVNDQTDQLTLHDRRLDEVKREFTSTHEAIVEHGQVLSEVHTILRKSTPDQTHFDGELNNYRRLINEGKARTALDLLVNQYGSAEKVAGIPLSIVSRAKALMAFCAHHLNENARAAALFEEAYELNPTNPKAIANRVFGLLLAQRAEEAFAFAKEAFKADPMNAGLGANLILAHRAAAADGSPTDGMPVTVRQSEEVSLALMQWLRWREDPEWKRIAHDALVRFPDADLARLFAAESELEDAVSVRNADTGQIRLAEIAKASTAADMLRAQWTEISESERAIGDVELATLHNCLLAYVVADRLSDALELAKKSFSYLGQHAKLKRLVATIAAQAQEEAFLDCVLLERFEPDIDIRLERALRRGNWDDALTLIMHERDQAGAQGVCSIDTLERCLRALARPKDQQASQFATILDETEADPHSDLCIARFTWRCGVFEVSNKALDRAVRGIDDMTPYDLRLQVAVEARERGQDETVIDLLANHIDPSRDTHERRWVAFAFASCQPTREQALRFFEGIPESDRDSFEMQVAIGHVHYNRGRPDLAVRHLRRAIELRPRELRTHLVLWQALRRTRQEEAASDVIRQVDPYRLA